MATSKATVRVYSTETGRVCPECGQPVAGCLCKRQRAGAPTTDGIVRIRRETKGRNGKGVTLIDGLPLTAEELNKLAKALKARCGTGGTVKDGIIEIQGDHRALLQQQLQQSGYKVKIAGG